MTEIPPSLLLVEDNDDDAFLTMRAISAGGITHQVHRCKDGQAVIDYLESLVPQLQTSRPPALPLLVLLDLKMPRLSGLEVLEWIRKHPIFRTLVVLALTSSNEPKDVAKAYQLNINAYLVKPSALKEMVDLAATIRSFWLEQKHFIPPIPELPATPDRS